MSYFGPVWVGINAVGRQVRLKQHCLQRSLDQQSYQIITRILLAMIKDVSLLSMGLMKLMQKNTTQINPAQEAAAILKKIKAEIPIEQCFLFGSGASGNFHADSDLDMLLVFSDTENMRDVQKKIYSQRWSHLPIDFILKNKTEFDQRKIFGGVCFEAFHNGQEIF